MEKGLKNKIRVCFFSPSSYSFFYEEKQKPFGGAEFQMFLLSNYIAENENINVSFFISNNKQKKTDTYKNIKLIKSISFQKQESLLMRIQNSIKLFFLLKKHKNDIIITTTANTIIGIIAFYSKILRIKHIHRTAHQKDLDQTWIKANGLKGKFYKYGLQNANVITVQCSDYHNLLKNNHNLNSKVLKNGFEVKKTKNYNKTEILWVGRFKKWKNPNLFIDLAKEIENEHFTMICPYNKKDEKEWLKLKQKANNLSNISFIEKVPFNEIQKYFNNAKLFVNTSYAEGFPNTFLQSAQAKTPIVSLNVNPDNFITEYNCGIYAKNDFHKLITKTKNLLKETDVQQKMGQNCYNYLKENHDINIIGKQLEKIILSL